MKGTFPIDKFRELRTPFYYYDTKVLRDTLACIRTEASRYDNYSVHYAVKANANPKVLTIIRESGLGADCVSGGEIRAAIKAGFPADKIVFAGVGKADWEINLGLDYDIFCFNVESVPELEIINELAAAKGKTANVAFRINPNVGGRYGACDRRVAGDAERQVHRAALPHRFADTGYGRFCGFVQPCQRAVG